MVSNILKNKSNNLMYYIWKVSGSNGEMDRLYFPEKFLYYNPHHFI